MGESIKIGSSQPKLKFEILSQKIPLLYGKDGEVIQDINNATLLEKKGLLEIDNIEDLPKELKGISNENNNRLTLAKKLKKSNFILKTIKNKQNV